jgi:hypothetical protein
VVIVHRQNGDHVALFKSSPFGKMAREVVHFLACQNVEDTPHGKLKAYLKETLCREKRCGAGRRSKKDPS